MGEASSKPKDAQDEAGESCEPNSSQKSKAESDSGPNAVESSGKALLDSFTSKLGMQKQKKAADDRPETPDPGTPRLVLVLPRLQGQVPSTLELENRRRLFLQRALRSALAAEGFGCIESFAFSDEGGLKGKEGWAMALGPRALERAAEAEAFLHKRTWKASTVGCEGQEFERWEKYSVDQGSPNLAPADVLALQQARAYNAVLPEQCEVADGEEEFAALKSLGRCTSLLAICESAGAVEQVVALHNLSENSELHQKWPRILTARRLPVEDAAKYFGISTAQYFLFLEEYTIWLMLPSLLGVVLYVSHVMSGSALSITATKGASCFMTFMTIWSTLFIEHWKSRRFELNYKLGFHEQSDRAYDPGAPASFQTGDSALGEAMKPGGSAERALVLSRYSQNIERLLDTSDKSPLMRKFRVLLFTAKTVIPMVLLLGVVGVVVHLLLWVGDVAEKTFDNVVMQNLPVVLYLVVAYFLEKIYHIIGRKLTKLEGHAVYAEHLKSSISKAVTFQLVNYLGWFLYVAFWMQDIALLQSQLMMFMTVKQGIGLSQETLVPMIQHRLTKGKAAADAKKDDTEAPKAGDGGASVVSDSAEGLRKRRGSGESGDKAAASGDCGGDELRAECERQLSLSKVDLGGEYLQLAVLFATTTSFAVAFPLGPLLALLHTLISRYSDAFKLLKLSQRAPPRYADPVIDQTWLEVFEAISNCAVCVNFACWSLAKEHSWTPFQMVAMEHVVLFFKFYAAWAIPDRPQGVERKEVAIDMLQRHNAISTASE